MPRKSKSLASMIATVLGSTAIVSCLNGTIGEGSPAITGSSGAGGTASTGSGTTNVFQADGPDTYVAKVKNILVGLAPTDDEIAQVTKDPKALGDLIDQWMAMPEYQDKMLTFFELAFQQTQIGTADFQDMLPPNGIGNVVYATTLIDNIKESFARTALALIDEGKPFNEAMTTKRLMMTPALMELYAFMDAYNVDDNQAINDSFAKANPTLDIVVESKAGPIPIAETLDPKSANYMHWYSSDVPAYGMKMGGDCAEDPILLPAKNKGAYAIHSILHGGIFSHKSQTQGMNCNARAGTVAGAQFTADDYNTWKMVTIRPPNGGEQPTKFYDIPTLRASSELVIGTPRPGFFSTPAFFANWPTNSSNQMRVTINQALIVATGMQVDGTDATTPQSTPGLDVDHAGPGTTCFFCHQTLDPTRSILSSTYSWYASAQSDPKEISQKGLFAFQGVIQPVSSIDDFASILASHPGFPAAWAQKLCYYVNSGPCLPDDPEFQRVVGVFKDSGLSWNALVHEIMASPLTTNVSETETTKESEIVAVERLGHLCSALDNRLGLVDICGLDVTLTKPKGALAQIAQIAGGLPSDGYGRGAVAPVLPNQPSLFYRAGLENICADVAGLVIDATPNMAMPNVKQWASADSDAAIGDFVHIVMALTSKDPRASQAEALLKAHYADAVKTGAAASDALKSTFIVACLAPSAIGVGM